MKFELVNENNDEDIWTLVKEEWKKLREEWDSEEEQNKEENEKRQTEEKSRIEEIWKNDKLSQWMWKKKRTCRENTKNFTTAIKKSDNSETMIVTIKHEVPKIVVLKVKDVSTQTDLNDFLDPLHSERFDSTTLQATKESNPSSHKKHQSATLFKPKLGTHPENKEEQPKEIDHETVNTVSKKGQPFCWNCGSPQHLFSACEVPVVRIFCFGCGEPGKNRKNCPRCSKKINKFCFRCGKQGVSIPTCPNCSEPKNFSKSP